VWANLLANAVKFSASKAERRVEVGSRREARRTVYWVRDNGVGFDPSLAGKLFGVFQRLHPQTEFEGTGIGLALVQRIIQRHGGAVWAEAAVGEGATFYFSLPDGGSRA
jgi:light-regulated signal transduction histidine kinase (bacteriophytochrome)